MTEEFFILKYPGNNPKGYCTVDQLDGVDDKWAVETGVSLATNPPHKVTMSMYADEPRNTVLPDYVQNMDCLLIVSPRLRAFFEAHEVSDVEYYPLEIKDHKGKVASNEYLIAHLINPVDCIDVAASGVTWISEELATRQILFIKRLVIDPIRVPEGRQLFFPRYYNKHPVLRRELAEAMGGEGFTNVKIVPVSK
jgi:hypothetical protein